MLICNDHKWMVSSPLTVTFQYRPRALNANYGAPEQNLILKAKEEKKKTSLSLKMTLL